MLALRLYFPLTPIVYHHNSGAVKRTPCNLTPTKASLGFRNTSTFREIRRTRTSVGTRCGAIAEDSSPKTSGENKYEKNGGEPSRGGQSGSSEPRW